MLSKIDFLTSLTEKRKGKPLTTADAKAAGGEHPANPPSGAQTPKRKRGQISLNAPLTPTTKVPEQPKSAVPSGPLTPPPSDPNAPKPKLPHPAVDTPLQPPQPSPDAPRPGRGSDTAAAGGRPDPPPQQPGSTPATPATTRGNAATTGQPSKTAQAASKMAGEVKPPARVQKAQDYRQALGIPEPPGEVPLGRPNTEPPVTAERRRADRQARETERQARAQTGAENRQAKVHDKIDKLQGRKIPFMAKLVAPFNTPLKRGVSDLTGGVLGAAKKSANFINYLAKSNRSKR